MEALPDTSTIEFKSKFVERYSKLTDWEAFKEVSLSWLRKSMRVNTLKISVADCKKRLESKGWKLIHVPWCPEGFWITGDRYDIGNLLEHTLGYIYVQEAASMIPPMVLGAKPGETVLDMCASPGSKTSQIAAHMENTGTLIANEVTGLRIAPLGINLQRCGVSNAIISRMDGSRIRGSFDRVLVDAPCSGTGTIRKSLKTIKMWNPNQIKSLSGLQYKLLRNGFRMVREGGTVVYSTCTLEPEENEGVVSRLLAEFPEAKILPIMFEGKRSKPVLSFGKDTYNGAVKDCLRIWPQDNDTEGFFVAKIMKGSSK